MERLLVLLVLLAIAAPINALGAERLTVHSGGPAQGSAPTIDGGMEASASVAPTVRTPAVFSKGKKKKVPSTASGASDSDCNFFTLSFEEYMEFTADPPPDGGDAHGDGAEKTDGEPPEDAGSAPEGANGSGTWEEDQGGVAPDPRVADYLGWISSTIVAVVVQASTCASTDALFGSIDDRQLHYVTTHQDRLLADMSRGNGEHLSTFAALLGCPLEVRPIFRARMQRSFARIYPSAAISPRGLLRNAKQVLRTRPSLAARCTAL
jgi:hypothetical protein